MSNFKTQVMRNAVKIQTKFNRDITEGWNLLLSGKDNDEVSFIVLIDDGTKLTGTMSLTGKDIMIEWESDVKFSLEGLTFGEDLEEALTEMVTLIRIEKYNEEIL